MEGIERGAEFWVVQRDDVMHVEDDRAFAANGAGVGKGEQSFCLKRLDGSGQGKLLP